MKRVFFPSLLCIVIVFCVSCKKNKKDLFEPQKLPTYYSFNGRTGISDNSTIESFDKQIIIAGNFGASITVLKLSRSGNLIWRRDLDAGDRSAASAIAESEDHNLFVCGRTDRVKYATKGDILLVKMKPNGDTLWTKTYGGPENEYGTNIITTSDGNLLISARTESFGAGSYGDLYLVKVDPDGNVIWSKTYADQDQEAPYHLLETKNGEYLITADNADNSSQSELYLLKVDKDGKQVWNKKLGSSRYKLGFSTVELPDGDLLICGKLNSSGLTNVTLIKTDHQGTVKWEKQYGDSELSETGRCVKLNPDGTILIAGFSMNVSANTSSLMVLKTDADGNQLFLKTFGSVSNNDGIGMNNSDADDIILTGAYIQGVFMTKVDKNGDYK